MSNGARIGLIAAGVAVAALAFVLLNPDDSSKKADDPATPPPQTAPAKTADEPTATARSAPPPPPEEIAVKGGKPAGGVREIKRKKGGTLRLVVTSDKPYEIHLHGYDVERGAAPGTPARFRVKTDIEGVFEIEVENTHTKIADLVVEPR